MAKGDCRRWSKGGPCTVPWMVRGDRFWGGTTYNSTIITMAFVRLWLFLQLLLSTKNLTSREVKAENFFMFESSKVTAPQDAYKQ